MQENAGTGEVAESGEIRREPGDNVDALANALQNATIAQPGEASTAGLARSRVGEGVDVVSWLATYLAQFCHFLRYPRSLALRKHLRNSRQSQADGIPTYYVAWSMIDQAGVLRPSRSRAGRGADGRQDLSRRGQSITPHDVQIQKSGRPAGRDRLVQTADTILHHAHMAEMARLRARNAELEAASSASAPARPLNATGSRPTAADLAGALQIMCKRSRM